VQIDSDQPRAGDKRVKKSEKRSSRIEIRACAHLSAYYYAIPSSGMFFKAN
jgi:hypothetical protein